MPRRLNQTSIDYVVIALSPALVMTLVGSLVFFLLAVFYQGAWTGRLHWVMFCFVFGAVLIARISIAEGFERAVPFGIALGLAVGVAANRFMDVQGTPIDAFSWAINWGLIALIWWCAHKLTWDCTVIDESQDASGQGLLEIAGLERPPADASQSGNAAPLVVEGITARARHVPEGWWQRYVEHQRRPHAPGVWVVYFSLAALPLFGIGGWFIPDVDVGRRRYVFWLLALYVASGMGLLLTTSFLGLRRYLRQRRIAMPARMSSLWLSIGAAIIGALLVFAMLLPRPSAEYAVSQLPFAVGSPDQSASQVAPIPKEGTEDEQPGTAPEPEPPNDQPTEHETEGKSDPQRSGQASESSEAKDEPNHQPSTDARSQSPSQQSGSAKSEGNGGKSRGQSKSQRKASQSKKDDSPDTRPDQGQEKDQAAKQQAERQETPKDPSNQQSDPTADQAKQNEAPREDSQGSNQPPAGAERKTPQPPEMAMPPPIELAAGGIAELLKWVFYGVVVLAVAYLLWRSRAEALQALREMLRGFGDLLAGLFGRRRPRVASGDAAAAIEFPPAPFSSYADPFAAGVANRYAIDELVRYSFEAFEAWAREHGCPHEPDQTPHELAREVAKLNRQIATDARNLAELYARAAFADDELPPTSADQLRQLWHAMRATAPAAW